MTAKVAYPGSEHSEFCAWRFGMKAACDCGVSRKKLDWPTHKPIALDAPIPGRHWYGGCDPDGSAVSPEGICDQCGGTACPECGHGFYPNGECGCT